MIVAVLHFIALFSFFTVVSVWNTVFGCIMLLSVSVVVFRRDILSFESTA